MSLADSIFAGCVICISPWFILACLRIPRYVRAFEQEGYEYARYRQWLSQTERRYQSVFAAVVCVAPFVVGGGFCYQPSFLFQFAFEYPVITGSVYLILAVIAFILAPHQTVTEEKSTLTPRVVRLAVTTFCLELIPIIFAVSVVHGAYVSVSDPRNSPETFGILALLYLSFIYVVTIIIGPIVFALTPYAVLGANLLNWPIDTALKKLRHQ